MVSEPNNILHDDNLRCLQAARDLWNSPPTLLVVDRDAAWSSTVAAALSQTALCRISRYTEPAEAVICGDWAGPRLDAVALALNPAADAIAFWARLISLRPELEILWVSESPTDPWGAIMSEFLRDPQVISRSGFVKALSTMLPEIAIRARARYLLRTTPAPPTPIVASRALLAQLPLPTAETNFRETYLRALAREGGSLRDLARRAGISASSLHSMFQKLGISRLPQRR